MTTYFIHKQLRNRLLLNINDVCPEDMFSIIFLLAVDATSKSSNASPRRVLPPITDDEFALQRMIEEAHVTVVQSPKLR